MEIDLTLVAISLWRSLMDFLDHSFLFAAFKFFLFVYAAVLLVNIVLLFLLQGLSSNVKQVLYGTERPIVSRADMTKRFEAMLSRLESGSVPEYKVAVLEADALADEILAGIGYEGENMTERLEHVKGGQLETRDLLVEAHAVRNQIVHDANFVLSREDAAKWLEYYRKFFDEVELL